MNLPGHFPGGPVVRTPSFHCGKYGFDPWFRELRSHMPWEKKKKVSILKFYLVRKHSVIPVMS